ncbi:uncharacterized protein LOC128133667 [Lactuca sativa]|uniref:uncharacterized protein LOC128133667 n=1 Tax=Lactuca sativa TaxID=4236 RepID=UPI0022AF7B60|nr:uncharacterized protein LOC128133667 [Lactuca sativa]
MKDHEVRHKVIGTELFLAMHLSLILAVMKSIFCWISPVLAVQNPATCNILHTELHNHLQVVDDSGREEAVESGRKVACVVLQVLFHEQVRVLQKSPEWPEIFKTVIVDTSNGKSEKSTQENEELESSEDDGMPPLEANTNRRPAELRSDTESDSEIEDS